jgi:hypothetical protein
LVRLHGEGLSDAAIARQLQRFQSFVGWHRQRLNLKANHSRHGGRHIKVSQSQEKSPSLDKSGGIVTHATQAAPSKDRLYDLTEPQASCLAPEVTPVIERKPTAESPSSTSDEPRDTYVSHHDKPAHKLGPQCPHCESYDTGHNIWLPTNVESYHCNTCKRAFALPKCEVQYVEWSEVKRIADSIYRHGHTLRGLAREYADDGVSRSAMLLYRICDELGANSKDPLQIAKQLDLKFSPYLSLDLTGIAIRKHDNNRPITPQAEKRARKLPGFFAGDPMTGYAYYGNIIKIPTNVDKLQQRKILVETYCKEIDALLAQLGGSFRMVICDPERALVAAIRKKLPSVPVQIDIVHLWRRLDTRILPTKRNPKVLPQRLEAWTQLKNKLHDILFACSKQEFNAKLDALLANREEWEWDDPMVKAVRLVTRYRTLLTTHFDYPDSPRSNNFAERLIESYEDKSQGRKAYNTVESALHNLRSYLNCLNFTPYTASKTGLNGFCPVQLARGKPTRDWLEIVYTGKRRRWKVRVSRSKNAHQNTKHDTQDKPEQEKT